MGLPVNLYIPIKLLSRSVVLKIRPYKGYGYSTRHQEYMQLQHEGDVEDTLL